MLQSRFILVDPGYGGDPIVVFDGAVSAIDPADNSVAFIVDEVYLPDTGENASLSIVRATFAPAPDFRNLRVGENLLVFARGSVRPLSPQLQILALLPSPLRR
jgi:hypothetical protein